MLERSAIHFRNTQTQELAITSVVGQKFHDMTHTLPMLLLAIL
jgi:hypothetical protein